MGRDYTTSCLLADVGGAYIDIIHNLHETAICQFLPGEVAVETILRQCLVSAPLPVGVSESLAELQGSGHVL